MATKEIGRGPVELTAAGSESPLAVLGPTPTVLHWHGEEFTLPEGGQWLARNDACPMQAFAWGKHAIGLQFHLEADEQGLERWYIGHIAELAAADVDVNELRAQAARTAANTDRGARKFMGRWLDDQGL